MSRVYAGDVAELKGVMKQTELEKTQEALKVAVTALQGMTTYSGRSDRALAQIAAILNPPLEMEEVPLVRWECKTCGTIQKGEYGRCGCMSADLSPDDTDFVKLTGTFLRAKPVPVERSVVLTYVKIGKNGGLSDWPKDPAYPTSSLFQRTAAEGKTVTLTATWQD